MRPIGGSIDSSNVGAGHAKLAICILVGQAKRLALNPPTSAWGRTMLGKRGGLAVQKKYSLDGKHPTERATQVRLSKQQRKKTTGTFEDSRPLRVLHLSLD